MYKPVVLALILAAVVTSSRRGVPLGLGLLLGSVSLALVTGMDAGTTVALLATAATRADTITLAVVVTGIAQLGKVMSHSGAFTNLLADARRLVRNQLALLSGIPALLSMLTIPGGAMMSASMVGEVGQELGLTATQKAACNNLFRHLWYFAYMIHPMYAVVEGLSGVSLGRMFVLGIGPGALAWAVALKTCTRGGQTAGPGSSARARAAGRLAYAALPILVVTVCRGIFRINFVLAVALGLAVAGLYGYTGPWDCRRLLSHYRLRLGYRPDLTLGLAALGVMVFQRFVAATGVNESLAQFISERGIPLPLAVLVLPFTLGLFSGSTYAAVGMAVPLFLTLVPAARYDRYVVFIYICALSGYMISPLHLCHVLSSQYFGVEQPRVVRQMLPALVTLITASALILLL